MTEGKVRTRSGYELHPPTIEDFLELLQRREEEHPYERSTRSTPERAVFATALSKPISSSMGIPAAQRWIQAQFIYGEYLVTYKRYTHHGYEMHPGNGPSPEEKEWREHWQQFRAEVRLHVRDRYSLEALPVLEMHITRHGE